MITRCVKGIIPTLVLFILGGALFAAPVSAADKLFTLYTARVMSQAYPWIASEAGLFKKYDLEIPLVFVTPGAPAVAAILSGEQRGGSDRCGQHYATFRGRQ
jgi:ABC-type nitrate/sulfonate/bicarbonate transport system substrate-binding protein